MRTFWKLILLIQISNSFCYFYETKSNDEDRTKADDATHGWGRKTSSEPRKKSRNLMSVFDIPRSERSLVTNKLPEQHSPTHDDGSSRTIQVNQQFSTSNFKLDTVSRQKRDEQTSTISDNDSQSPARIANLLEEGGNLVENTESLTESIESEKAVATTSKPTTTNIGHRAVISFDSDAESIEADSESNESKKPEEDGYDDVPTIEYSDESSKGKDNSNAEISSGFGEPNQPPVKPAKEENKGGNFGATHRKFTNCNL